MAGKRSHHRWMSMNSIWSLICLIELRTGAIILCHMPHTIPGMKSIKTSHISNARTLNMPIIGVDLMVRRGSSHHLQILIRPQQIFIFILFYFRQVLRQLRTGRFQSIFIEGQPHSRTLKSQVALRTTMQWILKGDLGRNHWRVSPLSVFLLVVFRSRISKSAEPVESHTHTSMMAWR